MSDLTFKADAVADGAMKTFEHGKHKVLIVREGSGYRAFDGKCPHAGADLGEGVLCAGRVVCPWHHATFDARSGALLEPLATEALTRYAVHRDGDDYRVDLSKPISPADAEPLLKDQHVVIVGAGAGGFMAAHTLRERGFAGALTLVDPEHAAPYERPMLSKMFLTGEVGVDELGMGGEDWAGKHRIDRRHSRATALDAKNHQLQMERGDPLHFDHLIVAAGAKPGRGDIPGADLEGVHTLRSLDDAKALKQAAKGKAVVIIGSNFIGMEAAASLVGKGGATSVTVVGKDAEVMHPMLSSTTARELRRLHESKGVVFHLAADIKAITGDQRASAVTLKNGTTLEAQLVLLGVGVHPRNALLKDFTDADGAVPVDAQMRAGEAIYAVGDIALAPTVMGPFRIEHWRVAMQQGMVAALSILEQAGARMDRRVPFFWTQQFGKSLRYVGHGAGDAPRHVWGDPAKLDFIEFSFDGQRTAAAAGMQRDTALAAFELLLKMGRAPSADEIRAGEFDLTERLSGASAASEQD